MLFCQAVSSIPASNSAVAALAASIAACHFAVGAGYIDTLKDYGNYTLEECHAMGINDSMIHVDFMIGTDDLSITAVTESGERVAIFTNGNWAF